MLKTLQKIYQSLDAALLIPVCFISVAGMITMNSFVEQSRFFERQIIWFVVALVLCITVSQIDMRILRRKESSLLLFVATCFVLLFVLLTGPVKGARSWFNLGAFAFQPVDFVKIVLIIILSKYFSRRHIEIANVRHILVSGFYAFVFFALVMLQPDFGSGIILFAIWFGMVLVSGISKKHLLAVFLIGVISFSGLWLFVFKEYQKARIMTFIHPLTDLQGAGYNAYQSTIAVGSGGIWGKGVGYGTQSKLQFLPEYETDFIFAAFSEEWGFVGALILFVLYGILFWRILDIARKGASNFETFFGFGVAIMILSHLIVHVGMNIGVMPVTGITMPFMSYGGSHLLAEFCALGIIMSQKSYSRVAGRDASKNEIIGVV
jgi:rod shape determining protein RodA